MVIPRRCPRHHPGSHQRAAHCDEVSPYSSLVFEEDTLEQPGVAVAGVTHTAGEKEQCATGHDNDAASSISTTKEEVRLPWPPGC